MNELQGPISKPVFHVKLGHTPLLKHFEGTYRADGTRTDAPSAEHTAIENSGNGIINKAESLMNTVMTTRSEIQHYVHETLDIPPLSGPEHGFVAVLLGAAVGYHAIEHKLKNYMKFTALPAFDNFISEACYAMSKACYQAYRPDALPFNNKREAISRSLIQRGHASIDELLKASFGEWPVKGLDIYGSNHRQVEIEGIGIPDSKPWQLTKKWKDHIAASKGGGSISGERIIFINKMKLGLLPGLFKKSAYATTLGHETTHILQGDHSFRLPETFGEDITWIICNESKLPHSKPFVRDIPSHMFVPEPSDVVSEERAKELAYDRDHHEIQARLHEVLTHGYQRWGSLPQNREQFMIVMKNSGLAMPEQFSSHLQSASEIEDIPVIFQPEKYSVRVINWLFETLTDEGKDYFWRKYMPRAYCDLIEMYGDRQGRERFGYGPNIRYQFNLHAAGEPNTVREMLKNLPARPLAETQQAELAATAISGKSPNTPGR